jgi:hypothetical protein
VQGRTGGTGQMTTAMTAPGTPGTYLVRTAIEVT